ncbi:MAG: glucose-1-phosphate thymidylyltransferase [Muribaculum sp.]|nr:glucose-1-phosphate thymidylyltransferase [Muribaculum sp.]
MTILFDTEWAHLNLLPLSFNRPLCDFRIGITTIREKWEKALRQSCGCLPVDYLKEKFLKLPQGDDASDCLFVAGNVLPDQELMKMVAALQFGEAIIDVRGEESDRIVAYRTSLHNFLENRPPLITRDLEDERKLRYIFDIFLHNDEMLCEDFIRLTNGRKSRPLSETNKVIGGYLDKDGNPLIFLEEGASVEGAILNTCGGPIYIGKDAQVMEGSCLRGPVALCRKSKVRMGAKIYGASTFGPYCKVGGEVDNTVIFGYSNKAHDGYLGNAVIGEWCNIGAGVNASNLKNDYSKIRVWNYASRSFMRTDLQFCGLIMGDHSKVGINCMFNTATVVGVGCNIHGSGFPRVFIPSFSDGSPAAGFSNLSLTKFYQIAERVMSRRELSLTDLDRRIYERVYEVALGLKGGQR